MIIAISGKIKSGKSLTRQIIQYLIFEYETHGQIINPFNINNDYNKSNNWVKKSFADSLKDIICILIGCTREDLESQEFKNKELGEEWDRLKVTYSDGYDELVDIFPLDYDFNNLIDAKSNVAYIHKKEVIKYTVRSLLQTIGTDLFRNQLHSNVWVNSTFNDFKGVDLYRKENPLYPWKFPNWIIDDMRFKNEYDAIKSRGGLTIRVVRDLYTFHNKVFTMEELQAYHVKEFGYPINRDYANEMLLVKGSMHSSETDLDNEIFHHTIHNNSDINDLVKQVEFILKQENII